jgi:uncharacterized cofD-like protein
MSIRSALPATSAVLSQQSGDTSGPINVVSLGGGTGLSTLLRGLKKHVRPSWEHGLFHLEQSVSEAPIGDLTAIVAVTDDGGSSGRLRRDLNILPPGDIRNCLIALAEDEALLSKVFQYRFTGGPDLHGHSFGNLFLAALAGITDDFAEAVRLSSTLLATRGRVIPATVEKVHLWAELEDGSTVAGETNIADVRCAIRRVHMSPPDALPVGETLDAIAAADLITIGPGSLYTSLVPNLLVAGIPQAIAASPAVKVYICNLMTQPNESLGMSAADHVRAIYDHAGGPIFDYVMVNRAPIPADMLADYTAEGAEQVRCDVEEIEKLGATVIQGDYLAAGTMARHATERLTSDLLKVATHHRSTAASVARASVSTMM